MKADIVSQGVTDFQAAQSQAVADFFGTFYDKVVADQPAQSGGGFSQDDVNAAVKAAVDPLNAQITADAQALSDAQSKAASAMADLKSQLDAVSAKEISEESAVKAIQDKAADLQTALDTIKQLLSS